MESEREKNEAQEFLRLLATSMAGLEKLQRDNPLNATLKAFVFSIGTWEWPLVREILAAGIAEDWQCDSTVLRSLAWSVFGGPNESKTSCENAFGWIQDAAQRGSKRNQFSQHTKWMYLTTCPYVKSHSIVPLSSDFDIDAADYQAPQQILH